MGRVAYGNPAYLMLPRRMVCASGILYLPKTDVLVMKYLQKQAAMQMLH